MQRKNVFIGTFIVGIAVLALLSLNWSKTSLQGQLVTLVHESYHGMCGSFDPCTHECICQTVQLYVGLEDMEYMESEECQVQPRNPPFKQSDCGAPLSQCGYWMMDGNAENGDSYCQCTWFDDPEFCSSTTGGTTGGGDPCAGVNCDDGNSCTTDSCSNGQCSHAPVISAACGTCQNEPVCNSANCFIYGSETFDANGCLTACGTCTLHPPGYPLPVFPTPRCPTPICAPIPEGCAASTGGVDSNGCPLNPCGYTCPTPNGEPQECPATCPTIDTYHLNTDPNCKETSVDSCGCPSYECALTASVQCCWAEGQCVEYGVQTPFGEDEEQYWKETEALENINTQGLDLLTTEQEKRAFCENLGNETVSSSAASTVSAHTSNSFSSSSASSGAADTSDSSASSGTADTSDSSSYSSISSEAVSTSNSSVGSSTASVLADASSSLSQEASECLPVSCAAPPEGCTYDLTAKVEGCGCPPLICNEESSASSITSVSVSTASSQVATSIAQIPAVPTIPTIPTTEEVHTVQSSSTAICGDGFVNQAFEECDDGNVKDYDDCSSVCQEETRIAYADTRVATVAICGDGVLQADEQCDDRNTNDNDGCSAACLLESGTAAVCGDAILTIGEVCDYGKANANLPNYCRTNCTAPICGDGIIDDRRNEQCDAGSANSYLPDACRPTCILPYCGDGIHDADEQCDDGNIKNDDGCSSMCTSELPTLVAGARICGNGQLEPGEQCDDRNTVDNDGCSRYCEVELTMPVQLVKPSAPPTQLEQQPTTLVAGESTTRVSPTGRASTPPSTSSVRSTVMPSYPSYPTYQQVSYQLPLAQLQPLIQSQGPAGQTGPAAMAVIGAGSAAGLSWIRRRRR